MVVSGSKTPTSPLPLAASALSWAMAEKSLVNEDAEREPAPPAPVVVVPPVVDFLDEPQAASSPAVVTKTTDQTHARFNESFIVPSRCDSNVSRLSHLPRNRPGDR